MLLVARPHLLRTCVCRLAPAGTLPALRDVDTVGDLRAWLAGAGGEHALHGLVERLLGDHSPGGCRGGMLA